jgi:hypothetical protein
MERKKRGRRFCFLLKHQRRRWSVLSLSESCYQPVSIHPYLVSTRCFNAHGLEPRYWTRVCPCRSQAARKTKKKPRAQRATSNIFAMFSEAQIQEFKEVSRWHLINYYSIHSRPRNSLVGRRGFTIRFHSLAFWHFSVCSCRHSASLTRRTMP